MTGPWKALFVSGTLEVGGSETKIVKLVNALTRSERDVGLAYLNPPETLLDRVDAAVPVTHLRRRGKYSVGSLLRLRRLVDIQYCVLVSVNFYPLLYVLPAAKWAGPARCRAVALVNTTEFVDRQRIWGRFYAPFLRRCDHIVYGCRAQQELWTTRYRLPIDRSSVIYNGVDTDHFADGKSRESAVHFRAGIGVPADAVMFGGIGRFAPEKNFDLLIRAIGTLNSSGRKTWLVLVGEGSEKIKLQTVAAEAGIGDKVIFTGVLKDVRPALAAMDVFVLPSRAVETFSNAALEAMAMSRPVVLSNVGGAMEMVESGRSGYLFTAGEEQQLVDILLKLYESRSARVALGQMARQRVMERFGFNGMLNRYVDLLQSMVPR